MGQSSHSHPQRRNGNREEDWSKLKPSWRNTESSCPCPSSSWEFGGCDGLHRGHRQPCFWSFFVFQSSPALIPVIAHGFAQQIFYILGVSAAALFLSSRLHYSISESPDMDSDSTTVSWTPKPYGEVWREFPWLFNSWVLHVLKTMDIKTFS